MMEAQDDISGIGYLEITFKAPSGTAVVKATNTGPTGLVSGTLNNGTFQSQLTFPRYSAQGQWKVSGIIVRDQAGNTTNLDAGTLNQPELQPEVSQTGVGDVTAPTVHSVSASPSTINTSVSSQIITLTMDAQDDVSGISTYQVTLRPPSGNAAVRSYGVADVARISGTINDGTFQSEASFPRYSAQGRWTVSQIVIRDRAGNTSTLNAGDLEQPELQPEINQTGIGDLERPTVTSVSVSPSTIDTSESFQDVTVAMEAQDDISGVYYYEITFKSPSGNATVKTSGVGVNNLVAGSLNDGTFRSTARFPRYSAQGQWTVSILIVHDNASNYRSDSSSVLNTQPGLQPEINVNAPKINCGSAPGSWIPSNIEVSCTASDAESGLANLSDAEFAIETSVAHDTETANASTSFRRVCNVAGSCATAGPISGIKIDRKAPEILISSPLDGASVDRNSSLTFSYSCVDGGSGVDTCVGDLPCGALVNTSTAGPKELSVTSTDRVGNSRTATVHFTVTEPMTDPGDGPTDPGDGPGEQDDYATVVLTDQPVSYWRLGSGGATIGDELGRYQGEFKNGAAPVGVTGVGGETGAGYFSGNGSYGYINGFPAPTTAYTLEVWAKAADTGDGMLIQQGGAGALFISGGRYVFRQVDTNVVASTGPTPGSFDHVVATWDGEVARIFVNGVLAGSAGSTKAPSGSGTIYIGYGDQAPWFRGYLDEAAYFGHALTPERVLAHYQAGLQVASPGPAAEPAASESDTQSAPAQTDEPIEAALAPDSWDEADETTSENTTEEPSTETQSRNAAMLKAKARKKARLRCRRKKNPGKRKACMRRVKRDFRQLRRPG